MSNSLNHWSGDSDPPRTTRSDYFAQKADFAGCLLGATLYGIVVILFFQCMGALLSPVNTSCRKLALATHAVVMFLVVTINTAMSLHGQSISYIDNRNFPGAYDVSDPGPLGYRFFIFPKPVNVAPYIMFFVNNWLADGLLLYRCCIIYSMNFWAIIFPCLLYIASVATGVIFIYQCTQPTSAMASFISFGYAFFSISFSLNVLLTLMIIIRIVSHLTDYQNIMGFQPRPIGIYHAIITMFIESSTLHSVSFLLYIVPWAGDSAISSIFFPVLVQAQVIAPFLIVLRVANRRALAGEYSASSTGTDGDTPSEDGIGVQSTVIQEVPS